MQPTKMGKLRWRIVDGEWWVAVSDLKELKDVVTEHAPHNFQLSDEDADHLLDEFISQECYKTCGGSGDDGYYVQQVQDYFAKQRKFWKDALKEFYSLGARGVKELPK